MEEKRSARPEWQNGELGRNNHENVPRTASGAVLVEAIVNESPNNVLTNEQCGGLFYAPSPRNKKAHSLHYPI